MPGMAEKSVGICLLGCGIVGGGVAKILREQRDLLRTRTGLEFDLRHVVVKEQKDFPAEHASLPMTTDAAAAIDDPRSDIVIELIGGTGVAGTFIERALKLRKPVVTANKSLLAARGPELFALARQHKSCIAFEASCGGGIPIIGSLLHGLAANQIHALLGIVNGTCNFILTQMTQKGWSYQQALAEAQKLGFAEANPTLDVSGRDPAQKLAILAGLAFNVRIAESDIHVEGIDTLEAADIGYARELGYVIKLLAIAEQSNGHVSLRVHPTLVHKTDMLAEVSGSFNAISVYGHALGHSLFYGRGAGRMPTASAVVADLIGVAMGTTVETFNRMKIYPDQTPPVKVLPFEDLTSRYYIRLTARDEPGVLAHITAALSKQGISLSAILQHEPSEDKTQVPVVITTHLAREGAVRNALAEIDALTTIQPPTVCLRIIDQPEEFGR
jgi:homoserine dehydrogenase